MPVFENHSLTTASGVGNDEPDVGGDGDANVDDGDNSIAPALLAPAAKRVDAGDCGVVGVVVVVVVVVAIVPPAPVAAATNVPMLDNHRALAFL